MSKGIFIFLFLSLSSLLSFSPLIILFPLHSFIHSFLTPPLLAHNLNNKLPPLHCRLSTIPHNNNCLFAQLLQPPRISSPSQHNTTHIYSHARYPTIKVQHPPSPYPHIPLTHPRPPWQRYLLKDLCPPYSIALGYHLQLCRRHPHHKRPYRHPYARRSIVERVRQLCS